MYKVQVDLPPVDQERSAQLVVHHLALAFGYFQAMPEGSEREALSAAIDEQFQGFNLEAEIAHRTCDDLVRVYDDLNFEDGESQQED